MLIQIVFTKFRNKFCQPYLKLMLRYMISNYQKLFYTIKVSFIKILQIKPYEFIFPRTNFQTNPKRGFSGLEIFKKSLSFYYYSHVHVKII